MTDQRLEELRQRWEADPGSRVFLQLAEEYRRLGRKDEAIHVLEQGLERSPNHLSAKVALGRCRLEKQEYGSAAGIFEEVLERDPTQLVANRLLVEAYIGQSEHAKATRRLDLYRLLNDGDPVIEELQERLEATAPAVPAEEDADGRFFEAEELEAPAEPADEPFSELLSAPAAPPAAEAVTEVEGPPDEELFPELHQQITRKRYLEGLVGEGIFLAEIPAEPEPRAASAEVLAPEAPAGEPEEWVEDLGEGLEATVDEEPFPELPQAVETAAATPAEEDRLFDLPAPTGLGATPEPLADLMAPAAPEVAEDVSAGAPAFTEEAVAESSTWAPETEAEPTAGDGGAEASARDWQEESSEENADEAAQEEAEELATVTLGHLYLDQGHRENAEKVFRKVLEREPGNAAARAALASLEETPKIDDEATPEEALSARELLVGVPPSAGLSERKAHLLKSYLRRVRGEA